MKSRLRDQRGAIMIMVALSLTALMCFAVIAIDGAMLQTTKNQLQNAADAAALAGASALIVGDSDEATIRAIDFAGKNSAVQEGMSPVVISAADVAFPEADVIRVTTHRTLATGDPLRTYFMRLIDPLDDNLSDVTAVAAARAYEVCATQCVKPWAIPDNWDDADSNGVWDPGELYDKVGTGYNAPADVGADLILKTNVENRVYPESFFYAVNFPPLGGSESPLTGASWYETWIGGCAPYTIGPGDELQVEPGNMVGPTKHGVEQLIALDPLATWDSATNTVTNSDFALSPRIGMIPLWDPTDWPTTGRRQVTVTKVAAFFIDRIQANTVYGKFLVLIAPGEPCEAGGGSGLVFGLSLIE